MDFYLGTVLDEMGVNNYNFMVTVDMKVEHQLKQHFSKVSKLTVDSIKETAREDGIVLVLGIT